MVVLLEVMSALPLLMMAINFVFALLARIGLRSTFVYKDYTFQPSVSVLLPAFNEGQHVLKTIESLMASNYPPERLEVIAVDDCSIDDTHMWIERAASNWPRVRALRNPVNVGKHHTLLNALSYASGDIIVCIDSDAIFDCNAISEVTACFADPEIGAVGGRIGISNPNENWLTRCQTLLYYYVFHVAKMWQNWTRNVLCISGCFFAVRREHLLAIEPEIKARAWFGIGVRDGEDSFMTLQLLLRGLKTYCNIEAQCWTAVPNNSRQFFMQQLRWRRSTFRNLFWMLRRFNAMVKVLHPVTAVYVLVQCASLVLWPMVMIGSLVSSSLVSMASHVALGMASYVATGYAFGLYARRHNPEQHVSALSVSIAGVWMVLDMFFLSILALCTQDVGEWGTRGVAQPHQPVPQMRATEELANSGGGQLAA